MQRKILFVHGFGVMKDSRGMFTELADVFSAHGITPILIDLNEKNDGGDIYMNSLSEQSRILRETYERECSDGSVVDMICHSQGCLVASLANIPDVRTTLFLAPPTENNPEKTISYFSKNPESVVDMNNTSRFARRDGTATFVPAIYWEDRARMNYQELYQNYISSHETVVVTALNDEVVSNEHINNIFGLVKIFPLSADHNFTGTAQEELRALVSSLLLL